MATSNVAIGDREALGRDLGLRVSRASQIPLYHQVANDIRQRIATDKWRPGQRIPSEAELVGTYAASRITIRQALSVLSQEGLVVRERGRGSFVRDPVIIARPSRLTSFTAEMRAKGIRSSSQVLSFTTEAADEDIARHLDLATGEAVLRLERLRLGDGEPIGIQVAWLPAALFPGLLDLDFSRVSLYDELEHRYGVIVNDAEETFSASLIDPHTAILLSVPVFAAAFRVTRVARNAGRAIEFTQSILRGDRYRVQVRLRRTQNERTGSVEDHEVGQGVA